MFKIKMLKNRVQRHLKNISFYKLKNILSNSVDYLGHRVECILEDKIMALIPDAFIYVYT